jgi:ribosomal protein L40E
VQKVKCPKCGYENPLDNQFCEDCGSQLSSSLPAQNIPIASAGSGNLTVCSSCRNQNPPGSVFCENCGASLPNTAAIPSPAPVQLQKPIVPKIQRMLVLPDGSEIAIESRKSIGRLDLTKFTDPTQIRWISRQHFEIFQENGTYYIEDEQSANGTKLNGTEIRQQGKQLLKDKDEIIVGDAIKVVFREKTQ